MRLTAILLTVLVALCWGSEAEAHFSEGTKPRTVLLTEHQDGRLMAYIRIPAPLLYAHEIVEAQRQQVPFEADFLTVTRIGNALTFFLSQSDIAADEEGFAERLNAAHVWRQNGIALITEVLRWRIHPGEPANPFSSPAEARTSLDTSTEIEDPNFGNAYVDFDLAIETTFPSTDLDLKSAHTALPLPPAVSIDNHIRDLRGDQAVSVTEEGQLQDWITIDGSRLNAALGFIWQGILHILIGADHVLLVVCIALGAGTLTHLVALVTAFTLGHAVTLVTAFLGYIPQAPWFIPAVEAAIAVTVLYAALAAWWRRIEAVWVFGAIGLLHGLGFSFVLSEILGPSSSALTLSLASFTLGIELGQVAILAIAVGVMAGLSRVSANASGWTRSGVLLACAAMAAVWTAERSLALLGLSDERPQSPLAENATSFTPASQETNVRFHPS
jgi:hypothetical protein